MFSLDTSNRINIFQIGCFLWLIRKKLEKYERTLKETGGTYESYPWRPQDKKQRNCSNGYVTPRPLMMEKKNISASNLNDIRKGPESSQDVQSWPDTLSSS